MNRDQFSLLINTFDNLPYAISYLDSKCIYQFCNKEYERITGLTCESIRGKRIFDIFSDELDEKLSLVIQDVLKTKKEASYVKEVPKIGSNSKFYNVKIIPLLDSIGELQGILINEEDVTPQNEQLAQLQKRYDDTKTHLESIVSHFPANVYWKDREGRILGDNLSHARMAGFNSQVEVLGKTDYDFPWKDQADRIRKNDLEVMNTEQTQTFEEAATLNNSEKINIFLTIKTPLYDRSKNVVGIIGISIDITERKQQEIMLKEEKIRAEAANKAKTEFLDNMRHDIRTPLTGIVGFAHIIADEVKSPKVKEYVDNLTASSYALLDLLNEILEVIRINSKEIPLEKKKFDLQKRLSDVVKLNLSKAQHKNIDLLFEYDPEITPYVIGDATRIHRIALELIANALNFTDKGFVKLTIQLAKKTKRELIIRMIAEDSGIGIAPDKQQEIFQQFKRLTPSYEGIYKGAGLGLSIVKQFIDELDGEIYVESEVGKGTKFTCVLPLKKPLLKDDFGSEKVVPVISPKEEVSVQAETIVSSEAREGETTRSHILLVEDQILAATAVKSILSGLNCQVDVASTGKIAVELAKKNNYDLIFMDIGLPDIDGYEVTKRVRLFELSQEGHVPIIALTAHVDEENKQNCLDVGMNAVISKPLNKEKAEEILNGFIPYRERPKAKKKVEATSESQEIEFLKLEGKIIDFELAKELLGGKKETVDEMLGVLVNSSNEELEKMKLAREKEDWTSVAAIAHKIKGGASYCGTVRLQEACLQMELSVKEGKKELFTQLYEQLLAEIKAVEEAVKNKSY